MKYSHYKYPFKVNELTADEGGGYLVTFSDFPGIMSDGETVDEAIANAYDALALYLDRIAEGLNKQ